MSRNSEGLELKQKFSRYLERDEEDQEVRFQGFLGPLGPSGFATFRALMFTALLSFRSHVGTVQRGSCMKSRH